MTPEAFLAARTVPLRLVIFDCDGVIVDSEGIANRVTAAAINTLGWALTPAEADRLFLGMTLTDMMPMIEARIGRPIPPGWREAMMTDFLQHLSQEATAIPGAVDAMRALNDMGLPWRIASNSSHEEMRVKFTRLGMSDFVAGRMHSHRDVARGKPAPDLFLATAAAEGVQPAECLVIEDSAVGARAAAAAGMPCLGYAPHHNDAALRKEGAVPFHSMFDLPALIRSTLRMSV